MNKRKKVDKYSTEGIRRFNKWLETYEWLDMVPSAIKRTSPETHIKPLSSLEDDWDGRDYLERD